MYKMADKPYQPKKETDMRYLVRVYNTDLDGSKSVLISLQKIKGVGFMLANAICTHNKINKLKKTGELTPDEIKRIEDVLKNPTKLPLWMLNRRKDPETGSDVHLTANDLNFIKDNDIKMMKKIKSYKGVRHMFGLTVRGQRTKSNFRKNKGKVHLGVIKTKAAPGSEKKEKKE